MSHQYHILPTSRNRCHIICWGEGGGLGSFLAHVLLPSAGGCHSEATSLSVLAVLCSLSKRIPQIETQPYYVPSHLVLRNSEGLFCIMLLLSGLTWNFMRLLSCFHCKEPFSVARFLMLLELFLSILWLSFLFYCMPVSCLKHQQ